MELTLCKSLWGEMSIILLFSKSLFTLVGYVFSKMSNYGITFILSISVWSSIGEQALGQSETALERPRKSSAFPSKLYAQAKFLSLHTTHDQQRY